MENLSQPPKKETKNSRKGIFLAIIVFLILLFSLGATVIFIRQRTGFFGRAFTPSTGSGEVVLENSYLFASPLSAQANNKEKIRITIFLLDSQGKGVYGQAVFLGQNESLEINPIQAVTDELGRAIFDIMAKVPAEYLIEARVGNQVLPQRIRVSFR
jgi:hypothetical protein